MTYHKRTYKGNQPKPNRDLQLYKQWQDGIPLKEMLSFFNITKQRFYQILRKVEQDKVADLTRK